MFDYPSRIQRFEPEAGRRIIVVSDIHANLPYFRGLLEKVGFSKDDYLIIDGDFLEKGGNSLDALRFVMELCRGGNVYPLCGNCDDWGHIYQSDYIDKHLTSYVNQKRNGLLFDMLTDAELEYSTQEQFTRSKWAMRERYREEWDFLCGLPHAIETEKFVFAHAAATPDKPLGEHTAGELMRNDRYRNLGYRHEKWTVVGHTPVVLYGENRVCANPVIDRETKLISIDGGCVLKDDGQLNALIIPHRDSDDFSYTYYDPFPQGTVSEAQQEGRRSYYIRWGDSTVDVLERGEEFSRCRHVRTGYEMDILTKYLFRNEPRTDCNDCTDYILPLETGDIVSVVESTGRGYLVKHNGVSGWYRGKLVLFSD